MEFINKQKTPAIHEGQEILTQMSSWHVQSHYEEREATPPFNKVYLFSNNLTNNFATDDDIISLSSVISNQINFVVDRRYSIFNMFTENNYFVNFCLNVPLLRTEMSLTPHAENVNSAAPFN
jgi:hypothetical protein